MTKTYGATKPEQIIALFEMRAAAAYHNVRMTSGRDTNPIWEKEADVWNDAAEIIRNTEFVGWTTGTPIVETTDETRVETSQRAAEPFQTATGALPSAFLSLDDAKIILEALTRPEAVESARKYMGPRETHAAAIATMKAAVMRAEAGRK